MSFRLASLNLLARIVRSSEAVSGKFVDRDAGNRETRQRAAGGNARCRADTPNCQVTATVLPDTPCRMANPNAKMRILVLAAYFLAAILPVLALGQGGRQAEVEPGQILAMAGHQAHMPVPDGLVDTTQQVLCQQHCLFVAGVLPEANNSAEGTARGADGKVAVDVLAASLAIPPPGRPPKIVVI